MPGSGPVRLFRPAVSLQAAGNETPVEYPNWLRLLELTMETVRARNECNVFETDCRGLGGDLRLRIVLHAPLAKAVPCVSETPLA
jgi:hypothetical protein